MPAHFHRLTLHRFRPRRRSRTFVSCSDVGVRIAVVAFVTVACSSKSSSPPPPPVAHSSDAAAPDAPGAAAPDSATAYKKHEATYRTADTKTVVDPALTATGKTYMVVSESEAATKVGRDILAAGGNAVDAVVATAFALEVAH